MSIEDYILLNQFKAQVTGQMGENVLYHKYTSQSDKTVYHVMVDVVIKAPYYGTTQIDQIIVSRYGIFVVEIKNMTGWIFGSPDQKFWTQKINRRSSYQFQNPIHQNFKHINALEKLLCLPHNKFISLVAFICDDIKTPMHQNVMRSFHYLDYIYRHNTVLLSEDDVLQAVRKISDNLLTHEEHMKHINEKRQHRDAPDENKHPVCARCGRKMVMRTAKTGKHKGNSLWGCSGYPSCRFIMHIKSSQEKEQERQKELRRMISILPG